MIALGVAHKKLSIRESGPSKTDASVSILAELLASSHLTILGGQILMKLYII